MPLASLEGFIRQVIGWREYVNGLYWHFGDDYRRGEPPRGDASAAGRPAPRPGRHVDGLRGGRSSTDIDRRGWVHHIPRLMVLANLAPHRGHRPDRLPGVDAPGLRRRRRLGDGAERHRHGRARGRRAHDDEAVRRRRRVHLAHGPTTAARAPSTRKQRTGDDACPFTTLYWDFLDRHRARVRGQPAHGAAGARARPTQRPAAGARRGQPRSSTVSMPAPCDGQHAGHGARAGCGSV